MERVRVLHLSARSDSGGGPEHISTLIRHQPDVDAFVSCPADGEYVPIYQDFLGTERVIPLAEPRHWLAQFRSLRSFVRKEGIDIVHSHGRAAGLLARPLAAASGVRSVHTFHGMHLSHHRLWRTFYVGLERCLGQITSRCIAVSASESEIAARYHFCSRDKLVVVPNGVEIEPGKVSRPDAGTGSAIVVFVGRMVDVKNPDLLADIVEQCHQDSELRGRLRFHVIGEGPLLGQFGDRLSALVASEYVVLLGAVKARSEIARAHVLLSTSRREGLPLVLLEALAEGVPVVATDVVGNRDVVESAAAGLLFNQQDPADAVEALRTLTDSEQWQSRSWDAQQYAVSRFAAERMGAETTEVYRAAITI